MKKSGKYMEKWRYNQKEKSFKENHKLDDMAEVRYIKRFQMMHTFFKENPSEAWQQVQINSCIWRRQPRRIRYLLDMEGKILNGLSLLSKRVVVDLSLIHISEPTRPY